MKSGSFLVEVGGVAWRVLGLEVQYQQVGRWTLAVMQSGKRDSVRCLKQRRVWSTTRSCIHTSPSPHPTKHSSSLEVLVLWVAVQSSYARHMRVAREDADPELARGRHVLHQMDEADALLCRGCERGECMC